MELKKKWYFIPENKWFENRKQVKEYIGGNYEFTKALKNRDVVFIKED